MCAPLSPPPPFPAPYSQSPTHHHSPRTGPLPRRPLPHHRPTKDVLLFLAQEQAARDNLFPWWDTPRLPQMANHRCVCRDVRFPQSFRVRVASCVNALPYATFFMKGLFPHHPHFPPPTAIHWSVPELTLHPTCKPINPRSLSEPFHAHLRTVATCSPSSWTA